MLRRLLILCLLTVLALSSAVAAWAAPQLPRITITPASGNQFQTFTISVTGLTPGSGYTQTYIDPSGEEFTFTAGGEPAVVWADENGSFTVFVVPAVDFAGGRAGRWQVLFCPIDGVVCWSARFTVLR